VDSTECLLNTGFTVQTYIIYIYKPGRQKDPHGWSIFLVQALNEPPEQGLWPLMTALTTILYLQRQGCS